ncbi:MAG: LapA family protein [Gudongella sp.]|nr:LapA family protein [Gudongella sp.]
MQKGFVIILILAVIIGIFALSNSEVVAIDFVFTEIMLSQAIVIFICVLLGALIASLFGLIRQMSLKKDIKELTTKNTNLQNEVDELKLRIGDKETQLSMLYARNSNKSIDEPVNDDLPSN